jgi:hypothetical protein
LIGVIVVDGADMVDKTDDRWMDGRWAKCSSYNPRRRLLGAERAGGSKVETLRRRQSRRE